MLIVPLIVLCLLTGCTDETPAPTVDIMQEELMRVERALGEEWAKLVRYGNFLLYCAEKKSVRCFAGQLHRRSAVFLHMILKPPGKRIFFAWRKVFMRILRQANECCFRLSKNLCNTHWRGSAHGFPGGKLSPPTGGDSAPAGAFRSATARRAALGAEMMRNAGRNVRDSPLYQASSGTFGFAVPLPTSLRSATFPPGEGISAVPI